MPNPVLRRRLLKAPYPHVAANFVAANSQFGSIADNAAFSMGAGARMTICCWVWMDDVTVNHALVTKGVITSAATMEYQLILAGGGAPRYDWRVSSGAATAVRQASTFGNVPTGVWHFVMARYDGTNISISVNDGTVNDTAFSADIQDSTNPFRLGAYSNGTTFHTGRMDSVGFWKVALTAAQITRLYRAGYGMSLCDLDVDLKTSLIAWYDLDGDLNDYHGGNHLTNNGNVSFTWGKR